MGGVSVTWLLSTAALLGVIFLAPGFRISNGESALIVALVVGLASSILSRLLRLATGPLSLALCAALLVLSDTFIFRVTALLIPGFAMLGLWPAFLGAIPLSALHLFLSDAGQRRHPRQRRFIWRQWRTASGRRLCSARSGPQQLPPG